MTLTPDRQATLLFESIATLLEQIPDPDDLVGAVHAISYTPSRSTQSPAVLPYGLDAVTDDWETGTIRTRNGCEEILTEIADEWADKLNYTGPGSHPDTHTPVCQWLADHTEHAYRALDTDTWESAMGEARRVHGIALHLAGLDPERSGVTCPACGGMTERHMLDDGLSDWLLCATCGTPWTLERLETLRRATIAIHNNTYITRREACTIFPITPARLRKLIERGRVRETGQGVSYADLVAVLAS